MLTWSDEFNGSGPADPTKWVNEVGGQGWENHELEYYTDGSTNAGQWNIPQLLVQSPRILLGRPPNEEPL
jgi:hypothetical protein